MQCSLRVVLLFLSFTLYSGNTLAVEGFDQLYEKPRQERSWGDILADFIGFNGYEKSYALVVGVSEFDDESFNDLPTNEDPIRVKDFLLNEAGFDYVRLLTEDKVTRQRLSDLMVDEYPDLLDENDRFLFYWSGHGVTRRFKQGSRGYLPIKNSPYDKYGRMISMADIKRWDGYLAAAKQRLFLLDSCFGGLAGSAGQSDKRISKINLLSQKSSHLLTAGTAEQQTIAYDEIGGSVFTRAIIDGLRGSADAANAYPRDGVVTLTELKGYVESRVDELRKEAGWEKTISPQMRQLRSSDGEFYFITSESKLSAMGLSQSEFQHGFPVSMSNQESAKKKLLPFSQVTFSAMSQCENTSVYVQNPGGRAVEIGVRDRKCVISIDGATKNDKQLSGCKHKDAVLYAREGIEVDTIIGEVSCTFAVN